LQVSHCSFATGMWRTNSPSPSLGWGGRTNICHMVKSHQPRCGFRREDQGPMMELTQEGKRREGLQGGWLTGKPHCQGVAKPRPSPLGLPWSQVLENVPTR
jgi:hypothetical protein